jgi:hypothetical protein
MSEKMNEAKMIKEGLDDFEEESVDSEQEFKESQEKYGFETNKTDEKSRKYKNPINSKEIESELVSLKGNAWGYAKIDKYLANHRLDFSEAEVFELGRAMGKRFYNDWEKDDTERKNVTEVLLELFTLKKVASRRFGNDGDPTYAQANVYETSDGKYIKIMDGRPVSNSHHNFNRFPVIAGEISGDEEIYKKQQKFWQETF